MFSSHASMSVDESGGGNADNETNHAAGRGASIREGEDRRGESSQGEGFQGEGFQGEGRQGR
ncbi:MAG TPA: hypothetical protein VMU33_14835 [Burkholderiaceae bacterium]|nr:hypothetical protein [Burkholderiaceae bacterium]